MWVPRFTTRLRPSSSVLPPRPPESPSHPQSIPGLWDPALSPLPYSLLADPFPEPSPLRAFGSSSRRPPAHSGPVAARPVVSQTPGWGPLSSGKRRRLAYFPATHPLPRSRSGSPGALRQGPSPPTGGRSPLAADQGPTRLAPRVPWAPPRRPPRPLFLFSVLADSFGRGRDVGWRKCR